VRIGAHTNSIGKRAFNQSLSQERAKKVREYLIAKGVDKSRLLAVGYGEGKPLVKAKTKQALQKNQRIEVVVTSLDKEEKKSQTVLAKKAVKETPTMRSSKGCQKSFTKIMSHNKIQFQYGKSLIKKRSYRLLDDLVKVAKECEKSQLIIAGHTDASGSRRMNKNLSQKRADAVRVYLIKSGIEAGRLKAIGYGEIKPIASNKTRLGRAQNRRIEFMIKKEK
jgi:outer membrane protein OmpA-like peptidoglycan-associated protein